MWQKIKKIIGKHNNFALTTHLQPDADGIGSSAALIELLLHLNKKVRLICDSNIPPQLTFLNYHGLFEQYDPLKSYDEIEVLFILDTHKKERIGRVADLIDKPSITTVIVDHHEVVDLFTKNAVIDKHACSVGAMIYSLYQEMGLSLNLNAAHGIYVSIMADTGRFCYSSTDRKAHKIAEECMRIGVDPDQMFAKVFKHITVDEIRILGRVLQHMETYFNDRVIIQEIRREDYEGIGDKLDIENVDLDYIHDVHNQIESLECFVLLRELKDQKVRVSLRSKSNLDIAKIMRALGGGGHKNAAGLSWKGSLKEVKEKILDLLKIELSIKE